MGVSCASSRPTPHLLVVDDEREIRDLLSRFLGRHGGFRVTTAADGREMRRRLAEWRIDLVILDVMLPKEDGLTLCRELRATSTVPVVMLTAKGDEVERIVGLEMGADDYVAKPFNPRELLARVKAVLRRVQELPANGHRPPSPRLRFSGWSLDVTARRLLSPDGVEVDLTDGEIDILAAFTGHPQRVLSRDQLLDLTGRRAAIPFDRSIDIQVSRLRRKIETRPERPTLIQTVRGGGYMLACAVESG